MDIDVDGRVVLVTGAGRGIGRVIAETFASEGAVTIGIDLAVPGDADDGVAVTVDWRVCDITDLGAVTALVDDIAAQHGRIDVLVNNAGINAEGDVETIDPALWDAAFDVNVRGTFHMCRAVIPHMKSRSSGRIINAASFAAIVPSVGAAAYGASKAAVAHFSRTLASELGPWDITVNSYAPGMIPTVMNGFADMSPAQQDERLSTLSLRRWGDALDVARLVCFLASDLAGYITGTLVDVSGGKLSTQAPRLAYERAGLLAAPSAG